MKPWRIRAFSGLLGMACWAAILSCGGAALAAGGHDGAGLLRTPRWSPYLVGFGIGVLSWLTALLSDNRLGASSAYLKTSAMIEGALPNNDANRRLPAYRRLSSPLDWGWMLLVGVVAGALLSSLLSGTFRWEFLPPLWATGFGETPLLRWVTSLVGGVLLSFGARWAGGCTSGHGISGTLQLSENSWVALLCFFVGGALTAQVLRLLGGF